MLLKVTVNGQEFFVDAPNKGTAKAFGKKQLKVEVTELSLADLQALDVSTVVKVEIEEKKEGAAAEATEANTAPAATEQAAEAVNY
jgi:hypothetical protein